MKYRTLTILGLLSFASPLFAVSSAFERVTPSSEERDYHPKVTLEVTEENKYLLGISNIGKEAWLVVCFEARKENEREFRKLIWKMPGARSDDIMLIVPLKINEDGTAQIHLSEELVSRSYVAIDFPNPVFDGDFYYTIDIPQFHKHLKKQS